MKKQFGLLCVLLLLSACASHDKDMENASAEELYNTAFEDLEATRYKKAAEGFEKIETEHPYSQWAVKSKLMEAYAYYKDEKYDDAIMVLDRFIKYHPGNEHIDYAYYMKGICYYDQIASADKDQGNTANAEEVFERLIALYPDSKYAEDARGKIKLTADYRAGQEMIVGRYYLKDNNYLSALNRFNVVLEEYQTTIQIEEALYREVEIYAILGMNQYANGYYKILRDNYPEGKWTEKAAKVMEKIGTKDVKKSNGVADLIKTSSTKESQVEEKEDKSWFSSWFGSKNTEAEKVTEVQKQVEEKEEDKSWFSGWFGSKDTEAEKETEVQKQVEEKKEGKSWFSGWFGSADNSEKAEDKKNETFLSAFGFDKSGEKSDEVKEISKTDKVTQEETVVEETAEKVTQTAKSEVGDIIAPTKKGKK